MALVDEVETRYSANLIVNLTNPDKPSATTKDSTRLATAATDAEYAFRTYGSLAYDGTNPQHVALAVRGVIAYLQERKSNSGKQAAANVERFHADIAELASVSSRARILPGSTSQQETSPERPSGTEAPTPFFDRRVFKNVTPDKPRGGDSNWTVP